LIARAQRHRGRETRAGSMTADGDMLRVDAQFRGVLRRPHRDGVGIVEGGRKPMLRSQSVPDGHYHRP
jgi:hypothetical protein